MNSPDALSRSFHDWESLRAQMVFVFDAPIPNGGADGYFERIGEYSAWLVRHGSGSVQAGKEEITVREGQWLFCFAEKIRQTLSPDIHLLSVRVRNSWPQGELLFRGPSFLLLEQTDYPELQELALAMLRDVAMPSWEGQTPSFTYQWKTRVTYFAYLDHQQRLFRWMQEVATILTAQGWKVHVPGGVDSRLAHVLNALDSMSLEQPFPTQKTLEACGLTIGQLNRLCQKVNGRTLHAYWEDRRVEQARAMLEQRGVTAKQVASALGFTQLSHFSAWFRRHVGSSPRQFVAGLASSPDPE